MWKLAPVGVWYQYDNVITYRVYMKGHFMPTIMIVMPYWIGCQRLHMCYPFQTPRRVISCWSDQAVPYLHDVGMSFRTGMKIPLWYSYCDELAPLWLSPMCDFVLVSCKQIQSHTRELEWTHTGMKVAPVSRKHSLIYIVNTISNSEKPRIKSVPCRFIGKECLFWPFYR